MWLLLLVAMVGLGAVRVLLLQPRLGEPLARQVGCVLGMCIILGMSGPFVRKLGSVSAGNLLGVGLFWLVLTVTFEFLFGRYVAGASWEALLTDYDVLRGRLWPLVLLTTLLAPSLWGIARVEGAR
jgi:hypothetical protein